jgi:hypothetical protein
MTLPYERLRAVISTRAFLFSLLDPRETPRIPLKIRREAGACLRHYPSQWEMDKRNIKESFHE